MLENAAKRDILPLGTAANAKPEERLTPYTINSATGAALTPGWIEKNETLISLGIPIGNTTNMHSFLKDKYKGAKLAISKACGLSSMSIIGRARILNANFYGKLRYYMWTLQFPPWLIKAIESDATHLIWKSKPTFDVTKLGTEGGYGKFIAKHATFRPIKKGGAGLLHIPSHIKAIHASWILRYLHPRVAQWKQVLDTWINIPRYAILHLSRTEQQQLIQRIPAGHHLISQAFKAFWELKLTMTEQYIRDKGTPDLVRAIPLAYNNFFKFSVSTLQTFSTAGIVRVGDLFNDNNDFHNWNHYWNSLNLTTNLTSTQIRNTIKTIRTAQNRIPKWVHSVLKKQRNWDTPFMCGWSDMDENPIYGIATDRHKLYELHVNDSGIGTTVSTPYSLGDWKPNEHLQQVATWGRLQMGSNLPPIIGYAASSYPHDEGWTIKNSNQQVRRSSLTVHRLTQIFSPESKPPNAEAAWNARLTHCQLQIDWPRIWSSIGTFLTTPADEKTWFKLIHRGLMVNGKEAANKECRLCGFHNESQLHLVCCPKLASVQSFVLSLIKEMDTRLSTIHVELTWLFGVDTRGTLLPPTHLALLRIYWRHVYAAMVKVKHDGDIFSPNLVIQNIARTFYSRILAFQHDRYIRYSRRRFSYQGNYLLPKSEVVKLKPIGELRRTDGRILVKPTIINIFQQQNIDCEHLQTSPMSPTSTTSSRGTHNTSCNNNNNNNSRITITGSNTVQAGISAALLSQLRQRVPCTTPNLANG
eukprot:1595470-Pleurochrysis_carterae.AAC.1